MEKRIHVDGVKATNLAYLENRLEQMYNDESIEVIDVKFSISAKEEQKRYCCLIIYKTK